MEATAGLARDHRVIEMVLPALERMAEGFEAREFVRGGEVARALRDIGYDGYLAAEVLPYPDPDAAARQTIESFRRWMTR